MKVAEVIQGLVGDIHRAIEMELPKCDTTKREFWFKKQEELINWASEFGVEVENKDV